MKERKTKWGDDKAKSQSMRTLYALISAVAGRSLDDPDHDAWGEQRGLKLLTAHRAKGLEFDDLVILDGGWEQPSWNEDQDAPRRLFYVAMTSCP